jgi:long-chain acyl-CoA synthetase
MSPLRTMLHVLHDQASRHEHRPALWSRRGRAYVPTSWAQYAGRVCRLALGLRTLGVGPGDTVPLLTSNREEWFVSALATMALGAVPVGLHPASTTEQVLHVVEHCEARTLVVEAPWLPLVQQGRQRLPRVRHVVVVEPPPSGLPEGCVPLGELLERGSGADEGPYWDSVHALQPDSLATLVYTPSTPGRPKGVMLSHRNLVWTAERLARAAGISEEDSLVCYLPLSHIAEQMSSLYVPLLSGAQVYFCDAPEQVGEALRQVRPSAFFAVPRVWRELRRRLEQELAEQPRVQQQLVEWARRVATERNALTLRHERVPLSLEAQHQVARRSVFHPLRESLGLGRGAYLAAGAAPMAGEVLEFFASLDMLVCELYGQPEACGPIALNTPQATRLGSMGRPLLGVEVRIAGDGEVLVRGGNVCLGYYKDPEATSALLAGGWLHTGDTGFLDSEGYLYLTGRKKGPGRP